MLRRIHIIVAVVAIAALTAAVSQAQQRAFVTDEFEITLRTGPTNTNKIVRMLPTGTRVNVLEEGDGWSRVEFEGKEGWVLTRYLTSETPKAIVIDVLSKKNARLAERTEKAQTELTDAKAEIKELRSKLQTATSELTDVSGAYETLSRDAAGVAELKKRYEDTASQLEIATTQVEELKVDNVQLSKQTKLNWFLYGAGVVGFSLLVGFIFGRSGRKRRTSLYS